jgi:hypothetical protein
MISKRLRYFRDTLKALEKKLYKVISGLVLEQRIRKVYITNVHAGQFQDLIEE